jgi:hypothetical protein
MAIDPRTLNTLDWLVELVADELVAALTNSDSKKNLKAQKAESTRIAKLVKEYEEIVSIANNRIAEADEKDLAAASELAYAKEMAETARIDRMAVDNDRSQLDKDVEEFTTHRTAELKAFGVSKKKASEDASLARNMLVAVEKREAAVGKMEADLAEKMAKLKAITG